MPTTLVLTSSAGEQAAQESEAGYTLQVDADSPVTMVVSTDPPDGEVAEVKLLRDGVEVAAPAGDDSREWELVGDQRFGTFKATAKEITQEHPEGDPDGIESPETTVVAAEVVPAAPPADGEGVVEVQVGEYDERYTAWAGGIFTALAVILLVIVSALVLGQIDWSDEAVAPAPSTTSTASTAPTPAEPPSGTPAADEAQTASPTPTATAEAVADAPNGTFSERSRLAISALLVAVGGVLLLAGAFLAALEVRGRQKAAQIPGLRVRGTAEVLEKVPEVLKRAAQLRGTIAVLLAGGLMLVLAVFTLVGAKALLLGPPSVEPSPSQEASEPAAKASGSAEPSASESTSATSEPQPTPSPSR